MHDIRQDSRNVTGAAPEGLLNKVYLGLYLSGITLIRYMATNDIVADGYHQGEARALFY